MESIVAMVTVNQYIKVALAFAHMYNNMYMYIGTPEQALGWLFLGLRLAVEDKPTDISCSYMLVHVHCLYVYVHVHVVHAMTVFGWLTTAMYRK